MGKAIEVPFLGKVLRLVPVILQFKSGGDALLMYGMDRDGDDEPEYPNEMFRMAVRLPQPAAEGCIWLKDYEMDEPSKTLLAAGLLEPTGRRCQTGFVEVRECRLTDDLRAIALHGEPKLEDLVGALQGEAWKRVG